MLKITLIIFFLFVAFNMPGDRITLKNQNVIEGMIESEDDERVVIRTATGEMSIRRDNIETVDKQSLDVSYQHLADQHFDRRQYRQAATYYENAHNHNPDNMEVKERLEETREILDQEDTREFMRLQEEIDQKLEKLDTYQDREDFQSLIQHLEELRENPQTPEPLVHSIEETLPEVYLSFADFLMDRMNKRFAIDQLEKALEMQPDRQDVRRQLADLYATESALRSKALPLYKDLYDQTEDPEILQQIVSLSERLNQLLDNFRYVRAYHELDPEDSLAERTYRTSLQRSLEDFQRRNNYEGMKRVYQEMESIGKEVEQETYTKLDFQIKSRDAGSEDTEAIIEASRFARENDLIRDGFSFIGRHFFRNQDNEELRDEYYTYSEVMLDNAQQALRRGNYNDAIRIVDIIRQNFPDFEARDELASLLHEAELAKERQEEAIRDRAMRLAQRGDDYYRRGLSYIQQMRRRDYEDSYFDNPYREGLKWMQRAHDMYQQAIELDPELARPEYADLRTKIADTRQKLGELENMRRHLQFYRIQSRDHTEPYYDDYYDNDYDDELDYY